MGRLAADLEDCGTDRGGKKKPGSEGKERPVSMFLDRKVL